MLSAFASGFLIFAWFATALFQIAAALGAPLGEYMNGGQKPGRLTNSMRIVAGIQALVLLGIAGHYVAQLGLLDPVLPEAQNNVVNWLLVGLTAISTLLNNLSKSPKERKLWGRVTATMLVAAVLVALAI